MSRARDQRGDARRGTDPTRSCVNAMLRIEVFDGDHRADQVLPRQAHQTIPGNRGLQIVNTLAQTLGTGDGRVIRKIL